MTAPIQAGIIRLVAGVVVAERPTCPGLSAITMVRLPSSGSSSVHSFSQCCPMSDLHRILGSLSVAASHCRDGEHVTQ